MTSAVTIGKETCRVLWKLTSSEESKDFLTARRLKPTPKAGDWGGSTFSRVVSLRQAGRGCRTNLRNRGVHNGWGAQAGTGRTDPRGGLLRVPAQPRTNQELCQ